VAGQGANCSNHPGHCGLTSVTIHPYPFHCSALPHSRKGMGEVNQLHYLRSFPTVNRTSSSIIDPTPTTPTGLGNPPQEQSCRQPCFKDRVDKLPQGQDCCSSTRQRKIYSCKSLSPLEAIKGEPGLTTRIRFTHTLPPHSSTEQRSPLCPLLSRDLGLSPLSQPACTPYCKHLWVQGYTESTATLDVGHSQPEPV